MSSFGCRPLSGIRATPPPLHHMRPGKRTGHTNREEENGIHTERRNKQTHRGDRAMITCKLGESERRGEAECPGGDEDPDQQMDVAPSARREREVPGWLVMVQHRGAREGEEEEEEEEDVSLGTLSRQSKMLWLRSEKAVPPPLRLNGL